MSVSSHTQRVGEGLLGGKTREFGVRILLLVYGCATRKRVLFFHRAPHGALRCHSAAGKNSSRCHGATSLSAGH